MSGGSIIALLGRQDSPTDAIEEYCLHLATGLQAHGLRLESVRVPWVEQGWAGTLRWLERASAGWQGRWVLVQYTALSWSSRGFPVRFLAMMKDLKRHRARVGVVFHDASPYEGARVVDVVRRAVQRRIMRRTAALADRTILTVPLERATWLNSKGKAVFIPIGSNVPVCCAAQTTDRNPREKTVVVFCGLTPGPSWSAERTALREAMQAALQRFAAVHLVVFGRGSKESEPALRQAFEGMRVRLSVLGLLPAVEISRLLASADAQLHVRGELSTRRGSAIAGIAHGLPVVGYCGAETAPPITDAGVCLVPVGDTQALGEALVRVLTDAAFRDELRARSLSAYRQHFAWSAIAARYMHALELRPSAEGP